MLKIGNSMGTPNGVAAVSLRLWKFSCKLTAALEIGGSFPVP